MKIHNIAALTDMLIATGFDEAIGKKLLQQICFKPADFALTERLVKGKDVLTCSLFFERKGEEYSCTYYDASFFKAIEVPELTINGIHLRDLDKAMAAIDWLNISAPVKFDLKNEASWLREQQIEKIVTDLFRVSATDEGRHHADSLKVRYWQDVSFAPVNLPAIRSKFEVSQRFYFFDGQGISIDEAYRFLLNRWLEKKLYARKKQAGDADDDTGSTASDKSLLQKKRKKRTTKLTR
jgi:hypothetical protein